MSPPSLVEAVGGVGRPHSIPPRICSVTPALKAHWVSVSTSVSRDPRLSSRLYRECKETGQNTLHCSALPAGPRTGPDEHIRPGLETPCHTGQKAELQGGWRDSIHPSHFPPILDSISSPLRTGIPLLPKGFKVAYKRKHSHKIRGKE